MPGYIGYAFLGALGLAASAVTAKVLLRYRLCDAGIVNWGMGLGAAAVAAVVWAAARPAFPIGAVWTVAGLGLSLSLSGWCFSRAIQEGDPSMVVPILSVKIPVTAALAFLILSESHSAPIYAAVALSAAAMALFGIGRQEPAQGGHGRRPMFAVALAVAAAVGYSLCDQLAKLSLEKATALSVTVWGHIFMAPLCLAMIARPYYRQYRIAKADMGLFALNGLFVIGAVWAFYAAFERADGVTVPNVILGSRGLFVLAAGFLLRGALKVPLERQPSSVYILRIAGTALFIIAIVLVSAAA